MIADFQYSRRILRMKLHDTIKRLFNKVLKPFLSVEVLSDVGWQQIDSINITEPCETISLRTQSGKTLICALDHILIDENGNEIFARDSLNKYVKTDLNNEQIIEIKHTNEMKVLYDLSLKDGSTHTYYTNGILSHNCVIIDEMGFIPKNIIDDFFASVMPIISSSKNSKAIVVSTPNGASGLYYDLWQEALANQRNNIKDGWQPFRIYWWDTGGIRDEAWKQQQIATVGIERWKQEYECDFLVSSSIVKLIPDDIVEKYKIKMSEMKTKGVKPKLQKIVSQDQKEVFEFEMWHEFQANHAYLASGDISEGIGADSSVLYIWDVTDMQNITMCARYSSNTTSLVQFAYIASKMLALYGNPWLAAERNGVSAGMLDSLKITYGYHNIIAENKKKLAGIYSHVQVKGKACLWAKEMMTNSCFNFTIYDKDLLEEMTYFVKKDTKGMHNVYHALPGPNSHDDHVMAWIWATYALDNERIQDYFIVVDTTTTSMGIVYPRYLQPLDAYTSEQLNAISNDPMYKDFLEFKKEAGTALDLAMQQEKREASTDIFQQQQHQQQDLYFNDNDGPSWNCTPLDWNTHPQLPQQPSLTGAKNKAASSYFIV